VTDRTVAVDKLAMKVVTALVSAVAQTVLMALKVAPPLLRLLEVVVAKWAVAAVDSA